MTIDTANKKPSGRARKVLAIAAGALLFVGGGATTLAVWQDSVTSDPTTISFGTFGLTQTGYSASINGQPVDPETDKAAPGDTVVLKYDYTVESDALNVVDLAADYAHSVGYSDGPAPAEVESWISTDVTGDSVVHQEVEGPRTR